MKIIFTGPESTGKTTLALQTSKYLNCLIIDEYARTYLESKNSEYQYNYNDLIHIADYQYQQIKKVQDQTIVIDTALITMKIWAMFRFNKYETIWDSWIKSLDNEIYFLCYPDIKWVFDPLRENPNDQIQLFKMYEKQLSHHQKKYFIITGSYKQRFQSIKDQLLYMKHDRL